MHVTKKHQNYRSVLKGMQSSIR